MSSSDKTVSSKPNSFIKARSLALLIFMRSGLTFSVDSATGSPAKSSSMSLKSASIGEASTLGLRPRLAPPCFESVSGRLLISGLTAGTLTSASVAVLILVDDFSSCLDAFLSVALAMTLATGLATGLAVTLTLVFGASGFATFTGDLEGALTAIVFLLAGTELAFLAGVTALATGLATDLETDLATGFEAVLTPALGAALTDDLTGVLTGNLAGVLAGALAFTGLVLVVALETGFATDLLAGLAAGFATGLTGLTVFFAPDVTCALTGFFGF